MTFGPKINVDYDPMASSSSLPDLFLSEVAYSHIESQLNFGYRIPGTNASRNCVQWIHDQFEYAGSAEIYNYSIQGIVCQNVIGRFNENQDNIIVFATHFDSRAIAEKDSNPISRTQPILGANDGASGVAVMLEMVRCMNEFNLASDYEFWFLFFDAEDQGSSGIAGWDWCEGSRMMADEMSSTPTKYFRNGLSLDSIKAFILLDMAGGTNLKYIDESNSNNVLLDSIFDVGQALGYSAAFPSSPINAGIEDDHIPFIEKGVPCADLIIQFWGGSAAPWPYHHTQSDNLQNIDKNSLLITGKTLLTWIEKYYLVTSSSTPPVYSNSGVPFYKTEWGIITLGVVSCVIILFGIDRYNRMKYRKQFQKERNAHLSDISSIPPNKKHEIKQEHSDEMLDQQNDFALNLKSDEIKKTKR